MVAGGCVVEKQPENVLRIDDLRRRIEQLETAGPNRGGMDTGDGVDTDDGVVSSGCAGLDRLLPGRGFRRGSLVEWLADGQGSGAATLAMISARLACDKTETCEARTLVVVDRRGEFYPPGAVNLGVELQRLIVVRPDSKADNDWALDQALRCPGVGAVLTWQRKLAGRTFRRLQLAVEQSGVLGLLIRPATARAEPSWAGVRLLVEPLLVRPLLGSRRLRITLLRCRGRASGQSIDVEIDDETHTVHPVAEQETSPRPVC
jgi:protein ImuA